ncbi:Tyrosine recombinase XerC [compost metagenome]
MRKQRALFYVKTVLCADGERLPTLLSGSTGIPDFDATLWVTSSLRPKNPASATLEQALRSVALLYEVLEARHVSLTSRLHDGIFLEPSDIEEIVIAAKRKSNEELLTKSKFNETPPSANSVISKVLSLEKLRMHPAFREKKELVKPETTALRLGYIRAFLYWRATKEIMRSKGTRKKELIELRDYANEIIRNETPSLRNPGFLDSRMGLDEDCCSQLLVITSIGDELNPWHGKFVQLRNQLIISLLLATGVRRSELLGLQIEDIDPRAQELLVLRRPDNPSDPRVDEPNAKTRDRSLPLSSQLYQLIQQYQIERFNLLKNTKQQHRFLFISTSGKPLSKSELNRLFRSLDGSPNLPLISPHILRHTHFEHLVGDLHAARLSDTQIMQLLRRLGGWSDTSKTPLKYIKRFIQEEAVNASLSMQSKLKIPF